MTNSRLEIDLFGNKCWRNIKNEFHRENGPAYINKTNGIFWLIDDKYHRIDGPASVYFDGDKYWRLNGKLVRRFEYD